ncbi:MAG: BamA/TamA family outer membrane protein, partial [Myxococcota bacterium]
KTSPYLIRELVGVTPGAVFSVAQLDRVRLRLLGTGYFTNIETRLIRGSERGHVILVVTVTERNTILLNDVFLGASRSHPFYGGFDLVEGNFLGKGLTLGSAFVVGNGQYGLQANVADPYAFALPLRLSALAYVLDGEEALFISDPTNNAREPLGLAFRRIGGELGAGLYPLALLGVFLDMGYDHIEGASDLPDQTAHLLHEGQSHHGWLRVTFEHDTRDNPLVPTSGYRLNLSIQGSSEGAASDYSYLKMVLRSSYHYGLGFRAEGHVIRFDLFGGAILGDAPFFERFFVGDVSSLVPLRALDMNFATRASPDYFNRGAHNLSYETLMAGTGIEYGIPIVEGGSPLYRLEFFIGAGIFGMTTPDELPGSREVSLGIDVIPESEPWLFPVDLTFDLGFRAETPVGVFGLSFANGLALVP